MLFLKAVSVSILTIIVAICAVIASYVHLDVMVFLFGMGVIMSGAIAIDFWKDYLKC